MRLKYELKYGISPGAPTQKDAQVAKMEHLYEMYYQAIERNGILPFASKWMEHGGFV